MPALGSLHPEPYLLGPPLDFSLLRGQAKPVLVLFEQKHAPPVTSCTPRPLRVPRPRH